MGSNISREEIQSIVDRSVDRTLLKLGIESDDPIEFQKDMAAVRDWRIARDTVRKSGIKWAVATVLAGLAALIWVGLKEEVSKFGL